jgi:hypothetical protein
MKTNNAVEIKIKSRPVSDEIQNEIKKWWFLFAEDYPENREFILEGCIGKCIEHFADCPRKSGFFINLRNAFLEAEKDINKKA